MKHFVITITENEKSVAVAERCIKSGAKYGLDIKKFDAITPEKDLDNLMMFNGIQQNGFVEKYSRQRNCMAAFMSHFSLWKMSVELKEEITIFEHDAVVVNEIPSFLLYAGCISFGKPSYGKWRDPARVGINPLTSKPYFPGAHAYRVSPYGAKQLIEQARKHARPTDVFLNLDTFPWLEEYYPWPVEARDTFTTIQKEEGCLAKHNYGSNYEII